MENTTKSLRGMHAAILTGVLSCAVALLCLSPQLAWAESSDLADAGESAVSAIVEDTGSAAGSDAVNADEGGSDAVDSADVADSAAGSDSQEDVAGGLDADEGSGIIEGDTVADDANTGSDVEAGSDEGDEDAVSAPDDADDQVSAESVEGSQAEAESGADAATQAEDAAAAATEYVNMYRLYNPNTGEHFYTSSLDEATSVTEAGWRYEGVGWVAPKSSAAPVYRLYNPNAGDHHYTTSLEERNMLVAAGWSYEGIGWYSEDEDAGVAVLRQYNPNATAGAHNFTTSSAENKSLVSAGWSGEGIAWYASNVATQTIKGRWIVTSAWGSLQRYWLDSTATIAKSRLVDPTTTRDLGAGYRAYATSTGAVVRGSYDSGSGYVYLADNDGKLVSGTAGSWLVTSKYAGSMQRYYLISANSIIVAKTGSFTVDGSHYYGRANVGYVVRGKLSYGAGMLLADNDGVLAWTEGWLVTGIYDGGVLQRYRIDASPGDGLMGAHIGLFELGGNKYYGRDDEGYVVRGYWIASDGSSYYADNDGVLDQYYWLSAVGRSLWSQIAGYDSGTQYLIAVDAVLCRTVVFQGSANNWVPLYDWSCGTGVPSANNGQGTPRGSFTIGGVGTDVGYEFGGQHGYRAEYYAAYDVRYLTCFVLDLGFHSTKNNYSDTSQIGCRISSGCVRLLCDNAKWIYENCMPGTRVVVI